MSFAKAKARMVYLIERIDLREGAGTVTSLANHRGRGGAQFRHRKESDDNAPPQDRGFWFDVDSNYSPNFLHQPGVQSVLANRRRAEGKIRVFYSKDANHSSIVDDAAADGDKIANALLHPDARGTLDTDKIIGIFIGDGKQNGKITYEKVEGGMIASLEFSCEYTNQY